MIASSRFFSHPDFTVGTGITPVHAQRLADYTAGRELHPAPKNLFLFLSLDYHVAERLSMTPYPFFEISVMTGYRYLINRHQS